MCTEEVQQVKASIHEKIKDYHWALRSFVALLILTLVNWLSYVTHGKNTFDLVVGVILTVLTLLMGLAAKGYYRDYLSEVNPDCLEAE